MTIQITHTAEAGTIVDGTSRGDGSAEILKAAGFRWGRSIGLWFVPQSRDRAAKLRYIQNAQTRLEAAGFEVEVSIDRTVRDAATVAADQAERLEDRRDALENKADRLAGERDQRRATVDHLSNLMNGQPILVGHHSEKRHRHDIDKMFTNMHKSVQLDREATETARRADASRRLETFKETGPALQRRIERLQAELRGVERQQIPCRTSGKRMKPEAAGRVITCPLCYAELTTTDVVPQHGCATGEHLEHLQEVQERLTGDITYCQERLSSAVESGYRIWAPADFRKGDYALGWSGWREVVRVSPKSLSVKTEYSWTDKVTYDSVRGKMDPVTRTFDPPEAESLTR